MEHFIFCIAEGYSVAWLYHIFFFFIHSKVGDIWAVPNCWALDVTLI